MYHIHALHGFLGESTEWPRMPFLKAYHLPTNFPVLPFEEWAAAFNEDIQTPNNIFMGYSLGGRLGLHAMLNNPRLWKAAIFISTHPGLKTEEERKVRLASDLQWSERFEKEPWESLMQAWNAQEVFKHDQPILRKEPENERLFLSKALKIWSLGIQQDLNAQIASLPIPILWMVGEKDLKFLNLGRQLTFKHPLSKLCIVPESGHRLQFGQSKQFISYVTHFIQHLGEQDDNLIS